MRYLLCALLLGGWVMAQDQTLAPQKSDGAKGAFYVDGIVYQYAAGADCTVVAAAHSALNHKFLAVKVRVYNAGRHSVTVKPEDVVLAEADGGPAVTPVSGGELARKLRKPYNMARYSVGSVAGNDPQTPITSDMASPQMLEMMRAIAARSNGGAASGGRNLLYTDTPGALEGEDGPPRPADCDLVCRLRNREAASVDALTQLQHQTAPDTVEEYAMMANTIPPHSNVAGILFYPLGKLPERAAAGVSGKKQRLVRVTVSVDGESFEFVLPAE